MSATSVIPTFTLGDRLRKARKVASIETEEMAELLGVSSRTVTNYESDATTVRRSVIVVWSQATNVDQDWLIYGDDSMGDMRGSKCTAASRWQMSLFGDDEDPGDYTDRQFRLAA